MSYFEPQTGRFSGSETYLAKISTAISTKRAADALERIVVLLEQITATLVETPDAE